MPPVKLGIYQPLEVPYVLHVQQEPFLTALQIHANNALLILILLLDLQLVLLVRQALSLRQEAHHAPLVQAGQSMIQVPGPAVLVQPIRILLLVLQPVLLVLQVRSQKQEVLLVQRVPLELSMIPLRVPVKVVG